MALGVWWVLRPRVRGVRCVILQGNQVLLVRQTYGNRKLWNLPGGGCKRNESPLHANQRETWEEVGVDASDAEQFTTIESFEDQKFCVIHGFSMTTRSRTVRIDETEILEAKWFPIADLPSPIRPSAAHLVELTK